MTPDEAATRISDLLDGLMYEDHMYHTAHDVYFGEFHLDIVDEKLEQNRFRVSVVHAP